jgi:hypothetical protein
MRRINFRSWTWWVALLLALTTTAGSAHACASTCLVYYGRFTIQDGKIYWYSSCTSYSVGGETYYNCWYKTVRF